MTLLRHGERSQAVLLLQQRLNQRGADLYPDGLFSDATEDAVRAFQGKVGLVTDGIAGPKTLAALGGGHCAHLLQQRSLVAAADRLGLELATVMAVNEVESLGEGFLANGKPSILFERHVMHRRLGMARLPEDEVAAFLVSHPNLVNPRPGGYAGGGAEHQRLANARLIDDDCALESTSWGAFQVMGYHAERLGYASVQDFTQRMAMNENEQFEAFVRFIEADPALHKALKARKWAVFAKGYNGPAYQRNLYDTRLERAYERHAAGCLVPA